MTPLLLTHFNPRTDDLFEIHLDEAGEIDVILHYVSRHGSAPIPYHSLDDVPRLHLDDIRTKIAQRQ